MIQESWIRNGLQLSVSRAALRQVKVKLQLDILRAVTGLLHGKIALMRRTEDPSYALAEIVLDGVAMSEAALELDWEEARFRCQLIATKAADAGHVAAGLAAVRVLDHLGSPETEPRDGYGDAMHRLSAEIDALRYAG